MESDLLTVGDIERLKDIIKIAPLCERAGIKYNTFMTYLHYANATGIPSDKFIDVERSRAITDTLNSYGLFFIKDAIKK